MPKNYPSISHTFYFTTMINQSTPFQRKKNTHRILLLNHHLKNHPCVFFQATNQPSPHQQPTISGHICPSPPPASVVSLWSFTFPRQIQHVSQLRSHVLAKLDPKSSGFVYVSTAIYPLGTCYACQMNIHLPPPKKYTQKILFPSNTWVVGKISSRPLRGGEA